MTSAQVVLDERDQVGGRPAGVRRGQLVEATRRRARSARSTSRGQASVGMAAVVGPALGRGEQPDRGIVVARGTEPQRMGSEGDQQHPVEREVLEHEPSRATDPRAFHQQGAELVGPRARPRRLVVHPRDERPGGGEQQPGRRAAHPRQVLLVDLPDGLVEEA